MNNLAVLHGSIHERNIVTSTLNYKGLEMTDIVVIGYRPLNAVKIEFVSSSGTGVYANQPRSGDSMGTPSSSTDSAAVNVSSTAANVPQAQEAAQRLAEAILQLKAKLLGISSTATVIVLGYTTTVGALLSDLNNTVFTITDNNDFVNNGVGAAQRGSAHNSDIINYNAITGTGGYGAPTYVENAGLVGLILHEMGHISQAGDNFFNQSYNYQRRDPTTKTSSFYSTQYAKNLEAFANDFMNRAASVIGQNLQGMLPGGRQNAVTPVTIYNSHVPPAMQE